MPQPIDLDRGVSKRIVASSGRAVIMYKNDPGFFYYADGTTAPVSEAKAAGFPVERLAKEKLRKELLKKAHEEIDAKFRAELGSAMKEIDAKAEEMINSDLKATGDMEFELDLTGKG